MPAVMLWALLLSGSALPVNPWTHDHVWLWHFGYTSDDCEKVAETFPASQHPRCVPVFGDILG